MAITLGQAYVQIMPSAEGLSGSITKVMNGEADSAGKESGKTFGHNLVSSAKKLIAAAGIGQALKTAITEGAALEQSIGGIETLFKDSSDKMLEYAKDAYSSAGLSANTYMEQATSFAASLLQSLDGDTSKAADAANQAIIDMADNANKMGTSIESIQNAYQGFAKQNYTMLDNLKLGYGGTKTEMERLIADANRINAEQGKITNYSIDNLSDVYSAINVIQGELGITGATALEASTTLSGSFASMKAAAQNFLGSLTLGEDITPALEGLVSTASTFLFNNLLPAVGNIVLALPSTIATFLQQAVPQILEQGITLINTIADGAENGIPGFIDTVLNILSNMVDTITEHLPDLVEAGIKLIVNLAEGLLKAIPRIIESVPKIVIKIVEGFLSIDWLSVGRQIIQGIANGIKNSASAIIDAAKSAARSALDAAKRFLGIQSPSKVFQNQVGKMIDLGLAEGITKNAGAVKDSVLDLAGIATTTISPDMAVSEVSNYTGAAIPNNDDIIAALAAVGNQITRAVRDKNFTATISADDIRRAVGRSQMRLGI